MSGQTKKRKTPGELREVLAQNMNRLMEQRYKESGNRPRALATDAGVSLSTVQRTLSREAGASIDTLESFAKVLMPGLPAFQLLVPWGMLGAMTQPDRPAGKTYTRAPLFTRSTKVRQRTLRTARRDR